MRGKATRPSFQSVFGRITPAYAGKSSAFANSAHTRRDHPRLCGEKFTDPPLALAGKGSPPPMRGKAKTTDESFQEDGITPAYAGKSR